jgi:acyl-CoA dehydrogenase
VTGFPSAEQVALQETAAAFVRAEVVPHVIASGNRPLVADQVVRHRLVAMPRRDDVARSCTRAVAARHVAGEDQLVKPLHLHGTEVERHYRDARVPGIGGGTTEVLDDLTATLLGHGG